MLNVRNELPSVSFLSRQIPYYSMPQSAYSFCQENKKDILMTEQFIVFWLKYSKTSALVLLKTDHSFQRGQQR